MDDLVDGFRRAQRTFGSLVRAVADDEWDSPTTNDGWTIADLVGHMVYWQRWMAPLLHGLSPDEAAKSVDADRDLPDSGGISEHYAAAWDEAAASSSAAYGEQDALERTIELMRGPTPSEAFLQEMIFELVVHSWDLARAIGVRYEMPGEVVEHVWDEYREYGDLSAIGVFDTPYGVPDDAPVLDQLIAMTGRDPR